MLRRDTNTILQNVSETYEVNQEKIIGVEQECRQLESLMKRKL